MRQFFLLHVVLYSGGGRLGGIKFWIGGHSVGKENHNRPFKATSIPPAPVAHTPNEAGEWDLLADHLLNVARRAGAFGAIFGAEALAYLLGLWHDLGKYSPAFQRYLLQAAQATQEKEEDAELAGKVDHSTAGAQYAFAQLPEPFGRLLAYGIAGHHAGLADAGSEGTRDIPGNLAARLFKKIPPLEGAPASILQGVKITQPALDFRRDHSSAVAFQIAFFGRMLFSSLVDADFLATEAHFSAKQQADRSTRPVNWEAWRDRVDALIQQKQAAALVRWGDSAVLRLRQQIYERCCLKAEDQPGFFSLTVPTGGGKTLASFAMAVRHVLAYQKSHGLRRIIYAMPFTSIIEQNAQVLRDVLQEDGDQVLEHHSNLDPDRITPWNKLASENWDGPLIVTTTVQLYESLFAARTSACRKLHNIAGSVIVLDEAQSLPLDLLEPTLAALAELVRNYKCTVILCTATQPAIGHRSDFPIGLQGVREVIENPVELAQALRRVEISDAGELDESTLAQRMAQTPQVLTIVDTRARAAALFQELRSQQVEALHLSAAMCPKHRSAILQEVRERLQQGRPCRVVSTQLIEAGVDVDFPVVYRALAGLDAIAQAAGRCNREGRRDRGQVYIFHYKGGAAAVPRGHQRQSAQVASQLIGLVDDLLSPEAQHRYFKLLYWDQSKRWDHEEVMPCFKDPQGLLFDYRTAAERYKLIKHEQKPVLVSWKRDGNDTEAEELLARVLNEHQPLGMRDYRLMQRYQVQIPTGHWQRLKATGEIQDIPERVAVLLNSKRYDDDFGLKLDDVVPLSPEDSVI